MYYDFSNFNYLAFLYGIVYFIEFLNGIVQFRILSTHMSLVFNMCMQNIMPFD